MSATTLLPTIASVDAQVIIAGLRLWSPDALFQLERMIGVDRAAVDDMLQSDGDLTALLRAPDCWDQLHTMLCLGALEGARDAGEAQAASAAASALLNLIGQELYPVEIEDNR